MNLWVENFATSGRWTCG